MNDKRIARGLGWVSIGLGLAEIVMPRRLERVMGIGDGENTGVIRTLGVREIMHGVNILTHRDPTPAIISRVAGDVMDGMLMGVAATRTRKPKGLAMVFGLVLPVIALDVLLAGRMSRKGKVSRLAGEYAMA